jgi:hypothetical protein
MSDTDIKIVRGLVEVELQAVNEGWQLGSKGYAERLQNILDELRSAK